MESFDLQAWGDQLALSPDVCILGAGSGTSPAGVVSTEYVRARAMAQGDIGSTCVTDLFVPSYGDTTEPAVTKVGGVPTRPRSLSWPSTSSGSPQVFIGQFCFTESRDFLPNLPGDLLLVFAKEEPPYTDRDSDGSTCLHFEWQSLSSLGEPLLLADLPYDATCRPQFVGCRHRTREILDAARFRKCLYAAIPDLQRRLNDASLNHEQYMCCLEHWRGIQIGGCSANGTEWYAGRRCLCVLSAFGATPESPYPWVNVAEPLSYREAAAASHNVLWYDGFTLRIYLSGDGSVEWSLQLQSEEVLV